MVSMSTSKVVEDVERKLSNLQSLAQVPLVDVDLKIQEGMEEKVRESLLNSSMLYMHDLHDARGRGSCTSTHTIPAETLMGLSTRDDDDAGPRDNKMCRSLPTLDEPATELQHFPYTSEQGG